jgi:hypothetical protein
MAKATIRVALIGREFMGRVKIEGNLFRGQAWQPVEERGRS